MAKAKCPYCGHENIMGADLCEKCLHSLTQKDAPQPGKDKMQRVIMTERVADFISKVPPIMVSPSTSMQEVVDKMHEFPKKGCVLICDEKKHLVGIVSVRDILLRVAGVIKDLKACPVSQVMTKNPEFLDKDTPLSFALHKMSIGKFRHVPVVDKGVPIGVVSTRDVIDYFFETRK
jgi:CBS domain-containing protein